MTDTPRDVSAPPATGGAPTRPQARGVFGGAAWRIGHVRDIEIVIDHSWLIIFVLISVSLSWSYQTLYPGWSAFERWLTAGLSSVVFFASIVLHELGHSLTALRFGLRVRSITLFVFGGVAALDSEPKRPRDEVLIALAGPAVSVALGLGFLALGDVLGGDALDPTPLAGGLIWLGRINLTLAVFNAIPGFPLDGGRVLRGVIWSRTGSFENATRIAGASGAAFAWTLILFGAAAAVFAGQIIGGLWMVLIGWFVLSASRAEVGHVVLERILGGQRIGDLMVPVDRACVAGSATLAEVASEIVLRRALRTAYVTDASGGLLGLLTLEDLAACPAEDRDRRRADEVMVPRERLIVVGPDEDAWSALRLMMEHNVNQLPVVDRGRLAGAVTREQLLARVRHMLQLSASPTERASSRR
jgi:Zn-dependent protease/CBS domain-containing protein